MPRIQPGPPCQVCGEPSTARNLCEKHYCRWKRHHHTNDTRPTDWGKREKHPLVSTWRWTARGIVGRCERWEDFWAFVEDVGERPSPKHSLRRKDDGLPFSPDNCFWKEGIIVEGHAEYQREWRRQNPAKARGYDFKRHYGISYATYQEMLERQGGVCALCGKEDPHFGLAVDHDHASKKVRGLLCGKCNQGIGCLNDSPALLRKAADYIESHESHAAGPILPRNEEEAEAWRLHWQAVSC